MKQTKNKRIHVQVCFVFKVTRVLIPFITLVGLFAFLSLCPSSRPCVAVSLGVVCFVTCSEAFQLPSWFVLQSFYNSSQHALQHIHMLTVLFRLVFYSSGHEVMCN